jgi:hypothetical protein
VGRLEQLLRAYENQPWAAAKDEKTRQGARVAHFRRIVSAMEMVLGGILDERVTRARETWPELPPLQLEGIDLVSCDLTKAEQHVAARFKQPEAAAAAKAKMRKAQTLAGVYRLQQELFELAFFDVWDTLETLSAPIDPAEQFAPRGSIEGFAGQSLVAQRFLTRVKSQLIETWLGYQIARLELYQALGVAPP